MKNNWNNLRKYGVTLAVATSILHASQVTSSAQTGGEDTWTRMADMPTARINLATCVLDGKIYAVGGIGGLRTVEVYDPASDTWTQKADMPTSRGMFGLETLHGKIYAMGGATSNQGPGIASVEEYDPATDTWVRKNNMPFRNSFHGTCMVRGKIYVIGGYPETIAFSDVYEFDPVADTWTKKANMPTARGMAHLAVVDDKIYAVGGFNTGWAALPTVEMYDPVTDTWATKANLPQGLLTKVGVANGKIYAFGGIPNKGATGVRNFYQYDPETDSWLQREDMPVNLAVPETESFEGSVYSFGGSRAGYPYSPSIANVWKFTPYPEPAWPDLIPLNVSGFEAEGITLGQDEDFFVGAFSYSSFFLGAELSAQSGAIYKGNLRTGEGSLLVEPTGTPISGLSYDARTDYLYAAKGTAQGGVLVYQGATGALIADITFTLGGDSKVINDVLVTETGVYCTDSTSTVLYKVLLGEGGSLPAEPVVEQLEMTGFVMDPDPTSFNANGIESTPDGSQLIVVNITTGILYLVDPESGAATPINVAGAETLFPDGDGLYLDNHTLYICQNFMNKIAVVQLGEDFTEGTFVWNLESPALDIPTTIIGYGDAIYAINTHFGVIASGNQAQVQPDVAKLLNVGTPSVTISDVEIEGEEMGRISFAWPAQLATRFSFFLETTEDLSTPFGETSTEVFATPQGYSFQYKPSPGHEKLFYRVGVRPVEPQ